MLLRGTDFAAAEDVVCCAVTADPNGSNATVSSSSFIPTNLMKNPGCRVCPYDVSVRGKVTSNDSRLVAGRRGLKVKPLPSCPLCLCGEFLNPYAPGCSWAIAGVVV